MLAAVPHHYQGVWRRALLTAPGVHDDRTLVLWMQTARWHADLRIPADRVDCSGCSSLADCNRRQLLSLLKQQGFAGITRVDGTRCEWQRRYDFHPTDQTDCGTMAFSACRQALDEYGIEAEYAERWEREPASSTSGMFAHGSSPEGSVLWLRSGERFMRVRPRVLDTAQAAALWRRAALHLESVATLRLLADFEISYGLIAAHDGCILHSTLPWLECQRVALPQDWSVD